MCYWNCQHQGNLRGRLLEATRKVDEVMNKIEVGNITELDDLLYAGAAMVTEMLGVNNRKSAGMDPWGANTERKSRHRWWEKCTN